MRIAVLAILGFSTLALSACGLPVDGPRGESVELNATVAIKQDEPQSVPYCLVPVTPSVIDVVRAAGPRYLGSLDHRPGKPGVRIGVGDVLSVTLFEAAAGGLFFATEGASRQGNYLTLPNQTVDNAGNISVPYAGAIRASGRTVTEIQKAIVDSLKSRALDPQAVVTIVEQRADLISVLGEVGNPVRYPASASNERLLDAIARAGGLRGAGQDSWVMLTRGNSVQSVPFEAVIRNPDNNIPIFAQDTIYVYKEPQTFLAFGATGKQGQVPFDDWRISLSEAIAKSGGLIDNQAEPSWVFLYRGERREVVEKLDPACKVTEGRLIPVIYEADLREPSGLFLATQFPMRNKDVVFVANARTFEHTKFFTYVQQVNRFVSDPIETAISAYTLKGLIEGGGTAIVTTTTSTTP